MSAAIDITLANRRKPWEVASWSEGQKRTSDTFATSSEMLQAAGLAGWDVRLQPTYVRGPLGRWQETGTYATVNKDGMVLGSGMSKRYRVLQSEEAFAFGDAIVDSGEAKWERAGKVRGGETVFGCMELQHLGVKVPGDDRGGDLQPYLLIVNSFGGWTPFCGIIAFIRPVCINTFQAAYGTKTPHRFAIKHTGTLDGKLQMAREALGIAFQHAEEVKALTQQLMTTRLVDQQVQDIIDQVWPKAPGAKRTDPRSEIAVAVQQQYDASPTLDGIRGTGWGLMNAVTEYLDHVADYRPQGKDAGDPTKGLELRGLNLMLDKAEKKKERVLQALLAV